MKSKQSCARYIKLANNGELYELEYDHSLNTSQYEKTRSEDSHRWLDIWPRVASILPLVGWISPREN